MKLSSLFLTVAILLMTLTACGGTSSNEQVTVGIIQLVDHPSLNEIREAFIEEMHNLGYYDVDFDVRIGPGADMGTLTSIAQLFVGQQVDMILAIATPAAQAAAATTSDIPIVFAALSNPIAAGVVSDLNYPDRNLTGTSDALPVADVFALARLLTPEARTFGFVYNMGESNSVAIIEQTKAYFATAGLSYLEATVTSTAEVQQAALSLVGHVDAFFTPTDNTVASAMPIFARVAIEAGIPIYTGADSMVRDGGFATVGINYTDLGIETARIAARVLEGTPIADIPVKLMEGYGPVVNRATAEAIGISLEGLEGIEIYEGTLP